MSEWPVEKWLAYFIVGVACCFAVEYIIRTWPRVLMWVSIAP